MNEEQNINDLMEAVTFQVARMDLPSQLSWYQEQIDAMTEDLADLGLELGQIIEEAIKEHVGDDVEIDVDLEDETVSIYEGETVGEVGDSIESIVERYKSLKVEMEVAS